MNFSVKPEGYLHRLLLACRFFLVLLVVAPVYASDVAALQLQSTAQVDGQGIFIQEIIKSSEALPLLKLCPAPAFGETKELTRAQVNDLLAKVAPALATTNWGGADTVRISRRCRNFDDAALLALLTKTLQDRYVGDKGELELTLAQPWTTVSLPDEPLSARVLEIPASGLSPYFITRFEIRANDETVGTFQLSLKAHIWRDVWVAHSSAQRGMAVADADLGRERRDLLSIREPVANFEEGDTKLEFAESVPTGFPVLAREVRLKSVIHRGQTADACLEDGTLTIKMKVVALEDGAPGQLIKLRNPSSSRYLTGRVVDDQTISISL